MLASATSVIVFALVAASQPTTRGASAMPEMLARIRTIVAEDVATGFETRNEIIDIVTEHVEDETGRDGLRRHVERITDEEIAKHREAEKTWPKITDCDRLDQAAAALEAAGIVVRQHFTDCMNCALSEIGAEMEGVGKGRKHKVRGYAFYHWQDTERARESGTLMIAYGAIDGGKGTGAEIGKEVTAALRQAGLEVNWNGSFDQRIEVRLSWKRRRKD